jgi:hypothetical protein
VVLLVIITLLSATPGKPLDLDTVKSDIAEVDAAARSFAIETKKFMIS